MSDTHSLFKAALYIANAARPAGSAHLGGPAPVLSAKLRAQLAMWCARRVGVSAEPSERSAIEQNLAEAHELLALADRELSRASRGRVADPKRHPKSRLSVARLAVDAALYAHGKPGSINRPVREAIQMSIRIERDSASSAAAATSTMRRFVEDLDQELMCREVEGMLARHVLETRRVTRVLWRRTLSRPFEQVNHVIAAVNENGFGLLFERRPRAYEWHEGNRDEVLATVPDELMADAVAAVFDNLRS